MRSRIIRLDQAQAFQAIHVLSDPGYIGGPVVIPNCIQVTMNWALSSGVQGHNVMYGARTGTLTVDQALANSFKAALAPNAEFTAMALHLAPTASLASVSVRDVSTAGNPLFTSNTAAVPGTSTGTELPNETAICVSLKTNKSGPAYRGRIYLPGWATTALAANNVIAAAVVTAINNWCGNRLFTAFTSNGMSWALGQPARAAYTGSSGTQHPARVAGYTTIASSSVRDNHWDSQRRRGLR